MTKSYLSTLNLHVRIFKCVNNTFENANKIKVVLEKINYVNKFFFFLEIFKLLTSYLKNKRNHTKCVHKNILFSSKTYLKTENNTNTLW